MKKVVLIRHGESAWNKENRFTGWTDVDLTPHGVNCSKKKASISIWFIPPTSKEPSRP